MRTLAILFYIIGVFTLFLSCNSNSKSNAFVDEEKDYISFYGNTQGTTFSIICNDAVEVTRDEIVNKLAAFDRALSSYIPNSIISQINNAPKGVISYRDSSGFFNTCYAQSKIIYELTEGAFDPTVYPLVDGWGFMKNPNNFPDSAKVDSLLALVGFKEGKHFKRLEDTVDSLGNTISHIYKNTDGAKLDFNAIAQGYSVDILAQLLEEKGAKNYFVEIGGEIRVKGLNTEGVLWRIGIDKPVDNSNADNRTIQDIIQLKDKSVATSGNYRKFYEKNGVKYSHTLNPLTGFPVQHSLLSATIVAENCMLADAYATVFMVMGPDKAINFMYKHPELGLEVYLFFVNDKGENEVYYTKDFRDRVVR
jgi:thiamine biosynthesis lipoprotein